jgi:hypothetical protein
MKRESYPFDSVPNAKLICELNARQWKEFPTRHWARVWQRPNGDHVVQVFTGGLGGSFIEPETREAEGVMKRYVGRNSLQPGQLLDGIVERKPKCDSFAYRQGRKIDYIHEPCRFLAYADAEGQSARVLNLDGKEELIETFEPYQFANYDSVWARIGQRWVKAEIRQAKQDDDTYEVLFGVEPSLNDRDQTERWVHATVTQEQLLPWDETVPCQEGDRVSAYINGRWRSGFTYIRWLSGCTYIRSSHVAGCHTVTTRWLRERAAQRVHPMVTTASAEFRQAA